MSGADLKRDFVKVLFLPALTFFLVPLGTIGFAKYGEAKIDRMILDSVETSIAGDASLDDEGKAAANAFYAAHPPSSVCADPNPDLDKYREAVCETGGEVWQGNGPVPQWECPTA